MSKHEQVDAPDPAADHNAAEPTEEEARMIAELDAEDDGSKATAPIEAAPPVVVSEPVAETTSEVQEPATPKATEPPPQAVAPPPATKPEAPKDFDAEFDALQAQFDAGDLDDAEFGKAQRALAREEGSYTATFAVYEAAQKAAVDQANATFTTVALAWESDHADFMSNPLRRQAMQQAINAIDAETQGSLPPAELFQRAQQASYDAFGYKDTMPVTDAANAKAKVDAAITARKPTPVPQTLAGHPAAAPIESNRNGTYGELDSMDISDLEDALARMTPDQQAAYLRDAPGATTTAAD